VQNWVYNQGSSTVGADGDVDFTAQPYKKAFEALVELEQAGLLAPQDADAAKVFDSGKSLFVPDGTWGISAHEAIKGLDFGIANCIALSADHPVNVMDSHQFAMLKSGQRGANRVAGVAAFVEYVRTHSDKWASAGQVVASKETFESPGYAKHLQSYLTSDAAEQKMFVIDNNVNTPYVMDALWGNSGDIVYGKIGVDAALTKMQKEVQGKIEQSGQG
jgi:multiple sugar transport system substrate-binding protein